MERNTGIEYTPRCCDKNREIEKQMKMQEAVFGTKEDLTEEN